MGTIVDGVVTEIRHFGVFIRVADSETFGLLHISQVTEGRIEGELTDVFNVGDPVKVRYNLNSLHTTRLPKSLCLGSFSFVFLV